MGHEPLHAQADIAFHAARARSYDEGVAREYAIYDELVLLPFLDRVAAGGGRVLDAGCGTGAVTLHLAQRGLAVDAVDHSPDMIAVAAEKLEAAGLADRVRFHVGDITALPFGTERFDGVACQRVLHHLRDAAPAVDELARVLRPGGWLYLADSIAGATVPARALRAFWASILTRGHRRPAPPGHGPHPPAGHEMLRRWDELAPVLDRTGLRYEARFYTHVGLTDRLSPRRRIQVTRALSAPFLHRRGDDLFVLGSKPGGGAA